MRCEVLANTAPQLPPRRDAGGAPRAAYDSPRGAYPRPPCLRGVSLKRHGVGEGETELGADLLFLKCQKMCLLTHSGCSIELRREALKGIPSANEGQRRLEAGTASAKDPATSTGAIRNTCLRR
jgi:DsbC/DsbD-like thiol-disulfide interchange protein